MYFKFTVSKENIKKFNTIRVSEKAYNTATQREKMNQNEYIAIVSKRAGIEGVPYDLRRRYKIDTMPIRGSLYSKLWAGFKIEAYNFNLIEYMFAEIINYLKFYFLEFETKLSN